MNLDIMVTRQCNFRCTYCYNDHEQVFMSEKVAEEVIQFAIGLSGPLIVTFIGGEIFLNFSIVKKIMQDIHTGYKGKVLMRLMTNLSILSPDIIDFLRNFEGVIEFMGSCDGSKEEHDRRRVFRDGSQSFDLVVRNLKNFLEVFPNIKVGMRYAENIEASWEGIMFLYSLGVRQINFAPIMFNEFDDEKQKEIFHDIFHRYLDFLKEGNNLIITTYFGSKNRSILCGAGYGNYAVDERGDIYPCYPLATQRVGLIGNVASGFNKEKKFFSYRIKKYSRDTYPQNKRYCYAEHVLSKLQSKGDICKVECSIDFYGQLEEIATFVREHREKIHPDVLAHVESYVFNSKNR